MAISQARGIIRLTYHDLPVDKAGDRPAQEDGRVVSGVMPSTYGQVFPPENAREQLARILREKMEHLDPTFSGELARENLSDRDREFYRHCVVELIHSELVHACLSQLSNYDRIDGCAKVSE